MRDEQEDAGAVVAVFSSSAAGERGARTAPSSVAMATVADAHTPAGGASVAGYTSATLTLTVQPPALDEQRQLHADPVSRLKRVTSSLSSLQTIQQALLRNSSLQNIVPTAHWTSACFMLVCANGAPFLLGLPAAMASLGWVGGLSVLCFGFVCIQFCATRLVSLHEHQGKRHRSYRDLARGVLGERLGTWAAVPFMFTVNIGTCVMYQVVSGQALHNICQAATQQQQDGSSCLSLTAWTLIFSASQLLLVLLPDVSNLSSIAAVGAATSLGYAALATIGAAVHGSDAAVSYNPQGSPADLAFNAFKSLGGIFLLFGATVLLDIQSTVSPVDGSAVQPMVKATLCGYTIIFAMFMAVAVSGFWAFGTAVQPIVFQSIKTPTWLIIAGFVCVVANSLPSYLVFAHSLFEHVELKMMLSHWTGLEYTNGPLLIAKRYGFRLLFVAATAGMAVCLPFMGLLMGLIGALGYVPLCFVLPCAMWLKAQRVEMSRLEVVANWTIIVLSLLVMLLAAIGSVRSLVISIDSYTFFS